MATTSQVQAALGLAQRILSSHFSKQDQAKFFVQLTKLIVHTQPSPFTPKEPIPSFASPETLRTLQAIQKQATKILPGLHENVSDLHSAVNSPANKTFGETPPETIHTLIHELYPGNAAPTGSFIDGGSGMGGPTLAAALSGKFSSVKGIELEPKWHRHALALQQAYNQHTTTNCLLEFICGDMTIKGTFADASCVFLNAVVWDADLSQRTGHHLEEDLSYPKRPQEDIFVVSMSNRMIALPSFDLVHVLYLQANNRLCTFYVNRRASCPAEHSLFPAVSDSSIMRSLRHSPLWDALTVAALHAEERVGMQFLIAAAASEPTVRALGQSSPQLWTRLLHSMQSHSTLQTKVLGSILLRAIVNHPIGRRLTTRQPALIALLIANIGNIQEHPAVRTNAVDVISNLLHDAPLCEFSNELDQLLASIQEEPDEAKTENMIEAVQELISMRRWWQGHPREFPVPRG